MKRKEPLTFSTAATQPGPGIKLASHSPMNNSTRGKIAVAASVKNCPARLLELFS